MDQPISSCAFNCNGNICAYSVSYDWSKVGMPLVLVCSDGHCQNFPLMPTIYIHSYILHLLSCKNGEGTFYSRAQGHEHHSTQKKNSIFLRSVQEEMKPRSKKRWDWVDVLWKPVKLVFMHAPLIVLHQQKDELKANIAHSERLWHVLQWKCKKPVKLSFITHTNTQYIQWFQTHSSFRPCLIDTHTDKQKF